MYVVDGISYAGEQTPVIKISGIRPLDDYKLWIRFSTGEVKIFDFAPLLTQPAFAPLADHDLFRGVYIDYGVAVWADGEIDIAPQYLYANAVPAENAAGA